MSKTKIFAGLLAVSLTSAALYAAPGMTDDTVTKAEALAKADKRFAKMDVNGDGSLSQADRAAKLKAQFAMIDTDKNGAISESEFLTARENRMEKRESRREMRDGHKGHGKVGHRGERGMNMMKLADANGDQTVSMAEFRTAAETRFANADANNDGVLTRDERKAIRRGMWDKNAAGPSQSN